MAEIKKIYASSHAPSFVRAWDVIAKSSVPTGEILGTGRPIAAARPDAIARDPLKRSGGLT